MEEQVVLGRPLEISRNSKDQEARQQNIILAILNPMAVINLSEATSVMIKEIIFKFTHFAQHFNLVLWKASRSWSGQVCLSCWHWPTYRTIPSPRSTFSALLIFTFLSWDDSEKEVLRTEVTVRKNQNNLLFNLYNSTFLDSHHGTQCKSVACFCFSFEQCFNQFQDFEVPHHL